MQWPWLHCRMHSPTFEPGDPAAWIDEVNAKFLFAELTSRIAVEGWDVQEALADFAKQAEEIKAKYEQV